MNNFLFDSSKWHKLAYNYGTLLSTLAVAHTNASERENASTQVLKGSWHTNGNDLIKSITAAVMTFGGRHAPIKEAYYLIDKLFYRNSKDWDRCIHELYGNNGIIAGIGSGFIKGSPDPLLLNIELELFANHHRYRLIGKALTDYLADRDSNIKGIAITNLTPKYPNLAFYTAACAHAMEIPIEFCEALMLEFRLHAWIGILADVKK